LKAAPCFASCSYCPPAVHSHSLFRLQCTAAVLALCSLLHAASNAVHCCSPSCFGCCTVHDCKGTAKHKSMHRQAGQNHHRSLYSCTAAVQLYFVRTAVQLYSSRTAVLRTYSCTAVQLYGRTRTLNTARALVHCAGWALIGRRVSFFIWPHSHSSLCAGRND
jgi:hypothetical protein